MGRKRHILDQGCEDNVDSQSLFRRLCDPVLTSYLLLNLLITRVGGLRSV